MRGVPPFFWKLGWGERSVLSKLLAALIAHSQPPLQGDGEREDSHELRGLRNGAAIFSKYSSNTILGIYFN